MTDKVEMIVGMVKPAFLSLTVKEKERVLEKIKDLIEPNVESEAKITAEQVQSNTVKTVELGDSSRFNFSPVQNSGGSLQLANFSDQTISKSNLEETLSSISVLQREIAISQEVSQLVKDSVDSKISELKEQLQSGDPDKSLISKTLAVLKNGLEGISSVVSPLDKVISLAIK